MQYLLRTFMPFHFVNPSQPLGLGYETCSQDLRNTVRRRLINHPVFDLSIWVLPLGLGYETCSQDLRNTVRRRLINHPVFDLSIWVFPRTGYVINTALKGNSYWLVLLFNSVYFAFISYIGVVTRRIWNLSIQK